MVLEKTTPGHRGPKLTATPKATYAATLKHSTTLEQEKEIRELAKRSGSAILHPLSSKPAYKTLVLELKQLLEGRRFSFVPDQQGTYTFTSAYALDTQLLKAKCTPNLRLAEHESECQRLRMTVV